MTDKNLWSFFGSLSLYSSPSSRWLLYYYHLLRGTVFKRTWHFCFPLSKPSKIGKCQTPWITGCERTEAGTFLATRYTIPYTTRIHRAKSQNIFPLSSFLFFLLHLFLFFFFKEVVFVDSACRQLLQRAVKWPMILSIQSFTLIPKLIGLFFVRSLVYRVPSNDRCRVKNR